MAQSSLLSRSDTQHLLSTFPAAWTLQSNITDMSYFLAAAIGLPDIPSNILHAMQYAQTPRIQIGNMKQALAWQVYSLINKKRLLDTSQYINLLKKLPMKKLSENQQYYDPNTLIEKTGATNGFRAYIGVVPKQQSGVVLLFNKYVSENKIVYAGRKILL